MPITIRSDHSDAFYAAYTRDEIKATMNTFKDLHLSDIKGVAKYLTCKVRYSDDALVMIALMMRQADTTPSSFYYDSAKQMLFACCMHFGISPEETEAKYRQVIKLVLQKPGYLRRITDFNGDPLFFDPPETEVIKPISLNVSATADPRIDENYPHTRIQPHFTNVFNPTDLEEP